jgi:predicted outer membrane repeat protein
MNISSCLFEGNSGGALGGGIGSDNSPITATHCTFRDNVATDGGGMYAFGAGPVIDHCFFIANRAGRNGGGLSCNDVYLLSYASHCTFWGNSAENGGAIHTSSAVTMPDHTIIAFNTGGGAASGTLGFSCSDLFANAGGDWTGFYGDDRANDFGNFSANPLFCDADGGDFTLFSRSPCLPGHHPGHHPDCGLIGALGEGCAPVSVEEETWAGIKARYRSAE